MVSLHECALTSGCGICSPLNACMAFSSSECPSCSSVWGSIENFDACGVCKGDNSTCLGCDGQPMSGFVVDECGVCGGGGSSCFQLSSSEWIGVSLAVLGNCLISVSLNAQKHAHNRNEQMGNLKRPYIHLPLWWIGMLLMGIGETGNFLAYAYAPATLVAPLGSISVVCNALLSSFVLREQITSRNKAGCALAIIGSCFVVRFAPTSDHQLNMSRLADYITDPVFVFFLVVILLGFAYLYRLPQRVQQGNVIVYVLMCSLMGAITVSCTKGLSTALILTVSGSSHDQFSSFLPWFLLFVICGTMVIQIKYLNLAMISFGASEVVPVYYVTFTFCSVMAGVILFKEYHETSLLHAFLFIVGVAITFGGVYLITSGMRPSGGEYVPSHDCENDALMTEEITLDDEDGEFEDPLGTRLAMMRV